MKDLNKLQTFVCVAEERSFTRAAHRLHVTPSAVSKQIADLEGQLSVALFNRSTRGVTMTEPGKALFSRCSNILDALDQAMLATRGLQAAPQGTLKVHASFGFAHRVLAPLLPKFMALYPDLQIEVTTSTPAMSLVKSGSDVVVSSKRMPDPGVAYRDVASTPLVICAAPAYFRLNGLPRHPKDLLGHNCLRHTIFAPRAWPFLEEGKRIAVRISGNFSSESSEVLRQVALQGGGIVRMPIYFVREDLEAGRLVPIFEEWAHATQRTRIYFPRGHYLPAKTIAFVDFLESELAAAPSPGCRHAIAEDA